MIPPRDLGPRDEAIFEGDDRYYNADSKFIRSNVWYGTSVENQKPPKNVFRTFSKSRPKFDS